jgi:hypothetical protein
MTKEEAELLIEESEFSLGLILGNDKFGHPTECFFVDAKINIDHERYFHIAY